jgi:hypothetical protein
MLDMRRREFIALIATAPTAWPLAARAQQPAMPVIGILGSVSPAPYAGFIEAIKQGLREAGYVEGRNIAIEYRWAEGQYDRLPQQALELVDRGVAVIILVGRRYHSGRQGRDRDDSDRLRHGGRSSEVRCGGGPQSSRRQCNGS